MQEGKTYEGFSWMGTSTFGTGFVLWRTLLRSLIRPYLRRYVVVGSHIRIFITLWRVWPWTLIRRLARTLSRMMSRTVHRAMYRALRRIISSTLVKIVRRAVSRTTGRSPPLRRNRSRTLVRILCRPVRRAWVLGRAMVSTLVKIMRGVDIRLRHCCWWSVLGEVGWPFTYRDCRMERFDSFSRGNSCKWLLRIFRKGRVASAVE